MVTLLQMSGSLPQGMGLGTLAVLILCALAIAGVLAWISVSWYRDREERRRLQRGDYP